MGVLSKLLKRAAKKYTKTKGNLYRKVPNSDRCGVCFLGAIALEGRPDRFVVDTRFSDGIRDTLTDKAASYEDILKAVGVSEEKINDEYGVKRSDARISESALSAFIPQLNDHSNCTFEQAAYILERRGL